MNRYGLTPIQRVILVGSAVLALLAFADLLFLDAMPVLVDLLFLLVSLGVAIFVGMRARQALATGAGDAGAGADTTAVATTEAAAPRPGKPLDLKKRLLLVGGYVAFFCVCFVLFAYWMFPYERVKAFLIQEVERPKGPDDRRRPSGLELEIGELSPSWLTGIELTGVELTQLPEEPDGEPTVVRLDEATARVSLLSLLVGEIAVGYDLEVGGGTIEGEYADSEEATVIHASFDSVDLERLGILRSAVGLPVSGRLDGEIDLNLANEPTETAGSVELTIRSLTVGDGEAKLKIGQMSDGITIEAIDAGTVTLNMEVDNGVARIQELSADGDDLELSGSGNVRLVRQVKNSRVDLLVRFKFKDAYRERNDRTRGLFTLLDMTPQLRPARTPDGGLQYRINGAFGSRVGTTPAGRAQPPGDGTPPARARSRRAEPDEEDDEEEE